MHVLLGWRRSLTTSLKVPKAFRPTSERKVGMPSMPAFLRFYAVNRGAFALPLGPPRSSFLGAGHYPGLWDREHFGVLGPFSLFLRFSVRSG